MLAATVALSSIFVLQIMLTDSIYALVWLLVLFWSLHYFKLFKTDQLGKWDLSIAFLLKIAAGALYIFVYSSIYGTVKGELNYDASDFLYESKQLHDIFFDSPKTYFKLLFEIDDDSALVRQYVDGTIHWSRGNLILINDSKNLVKIHSVVQFFSFNNIYVHFIVFNFISLMGLRNLYLATKKFVKMNKRVFFFAMILLPSALFWGSSVLKEPLIIFGMGLLLRSLLDFDISRRKKGIYALISIVILVAFKPYILISFFVAFLFYHFTNYFLKTRVFASLVVFTLASVLALTLFSDLRKKMVHFVSRKQFDFENIGQGGIHTENDKDSLTYYFPSETYKNLDIKEGHFYIKKTTTAFKFRYGFKDTIVRYRLEPDSTKWRIKNYVPGSDSYIKTTLIFSSFRQLIFNIPEALNNALVRPYLTDPGKNLKFFACFETYALFAFLLFALIGRRKLREGELNFIISCLIFVVCLALIIGWTTPVLGAIVRYRMPAYYVLLLIAFILYNPISLWKKKKNTSS